MFVSVHILWQFQEKNLKVIYSTICLQEKLTQCLKKIISVLLKHQSRFVAFLYSIITFKGANNNSSMPIFNYFRGDDKTGQQNKQGK